jgi:catechol 2,3-dioxygenase-like lactoylglutathione lyase family enzyme
MQLTLRQLRIARPVSDIERSKTLYCRALGLEVLGSFADHAGFDGVMLGIPGLDWHLEFTFCANHPVEPSHTEEDLLVLYSARTDNFENVCAWLVASGFKRVVAFNPYWEEHGATFMDHDQYRLVIARSR